MRPDTGSMQKTNTVSQRKASTTLPTKIGFFKAVRAVAWSFFGVRKHQDFEEDIKHIKPYHVIAIGLIGGFLFVILLMVFVNLIV